MPTVPCVDCGVPLLLRGKNPPKRCQPCAVVHRRAVARLRYDPAKQRLKDDAKRFPCASCGRLLHRGPGMLGPGRSICRECRRAAWTTKQRAARPCPVCATVFVPKSDSHRRCSARCAAIDDRVVRPNSHRRFRNLRRLILSEEDACHLCGQRVDKELQWPHPMCPVIDHVVPLARGGSKLERTNLRLAHNRCNRKKGARRGLPAFG